MSHEGKMRRGEISTDPTNIDRIYFLDQTQPKPVAETIAKPVEKPVKEVKKEKKNVN